VALARPAELHHLPLVHIEEHAPRSTTRRERRGRAEVGRGRCCSIATSLWGGVRR